jgi:hypothetical protein
MKKLFMLNIVIIALLSNCATSGFGSTGFLFTSHKVGVYGTELDGTKKGKACADSYLGIIAVGDGSVSEAAKKQNITKVKIINLESFSILGLYASLCTIVIGD